MGCLLTDPSLLNFHYIDFHQKSMSSNWQWFELCNPFWSKISTSLKRKIIRSSVKSSISFWIQKELNCIRPYHSTRSPKPLQSRSPRDWYPDSLASNSFRTRGIDLRRIDSAPRRSPHSGSWAGLDSEIPLIRPHRRRITKSRGNMNRAAICWFLASPSGEGFVRVEVREG